MILISWLCALWSFALLYLVFDRKKETTLCTRGLERMPCAPSLLPFYKQQEKKGFSFLFFFFFKPSLLTLSVHSEASSWALTCSQPVPNRKWCNRSHIDGSTFFIKKDWMANLLINRHKLWYIFFHTGLTLTSINIITLHWLWHHLISRRKFTPHI